MIGVPSNTTWDSTHSQLASIQAIAHANGPLLPQTGITSLNFGVVYSNLHYTVLHPMKLFHILDSCNSTLFVSSVPSTKNCEECRQFYHNTVTPVTCYWFISNYLDLPIKHSDLSTWSYCRVDLDSLQHFISQFWNKVAGLHLTHFCYNTYCYLYNIKALRDTFQEITWCFFFWICKVLDPPLPWNITLICHGLTCKNMPKTRVSCMREKPSFRC